MNRILAAVFFAFLMATAVCTQTRTRALADASAKLLAEAKRAIDKGNAQWTEAWRKGDASMIASIFADDGVMLGSGGRIFKGRNQILERQKVAMKSVDPGTKVTVTTIDLWLDGDTVYETGKYKYEYKTNGKPGTDEGRYVTIWKRQRDGSWKLFMDMGVPQDMPSEQKKSPAQSTPSNANSSNPGYGGNHFSNKMPDFGSCEGLCRR